MNKRNLQNSELDLIGRKLIERGRLPLAEIDKAISNPELFSLINARIAANGKTPVPTGFMVSQGFLFIRRNAVALGGIAVLVIAAFAAVSLLRSEKDLIAANAVQVPAAMPVAARPDLPPQEVEVGRNPSPGRAQDRDFTYEKAVVRQAPNAIGRKPQRSADIEPEADFYPISYSGDPAETSDGGRIIRVDIKRSSLFAMGINLPLENDDEFVKADLLVGANGVTRGIRVVK